MSAVPIIAAVGAVSTSTSERDWLPPLSPEVAPAPTRQPIDPAVRIRPPIDEARVARAAAHVFGPGGRDSKRGRENIMRSPMAYLKKAVTTARKLFVRWVTLTDEERREEAEKGGGPYVPAWRERSLWAWDAQDEQGGGGWWPQ